MVTGLAFPILLIVSSLVLNVGDSVPVISMRFPRYEFNYVAAFELTGNASVLSFIRTESPFDSRTQPRMVTDPPDCCSRPGANLLTDLTLPT